MAELNKQSPGYYTIAGGYFYIAFWAKKNLHISVEVCVFALPIFTASHPATIVGVHVLNFCVRDGNRWTHMTINTNSFAEEVFPFLYKTSFHSFFYLVTHTGFEPMLTA